jgi:hypothetical protein
MTTIYQSVTLETRVCRCGVVFAAPAEFWRERERDGASFHCPNGHMTH